MPETVSGLPQGQYTALDLQRYQVQENKRVLVAEGVAMRVRSGFLLDGTVYLSGKLFIED